MYDKNLIIKLFFTFMIFCLIYLFVFPVDFFSSFFKILLFLYIPDTRIGTIVTFLTIYIVYIIKRNNVINTLDNSDKLYDIIFAVIIAFFMNGMIQLLSEDGLIYRFDIPFLINKYEFIILSFIITFIIAVPYMIFIFHSKGKHSLSVLIANTLFGLASLFLTTMISLKEINMYFDKSKPKIIKGIVEDKRTGSTYNRQGYGKLYYITYSGYEEREVPISTYNEMSISDKVNVYINDGYLGVKWISKIEKI